MHRFFVPPHWLDGQQATLQDGVAHQIRTVLRMKEGHQLVLLDNEGWAYDGVITAVSRHEVQVEIVDKWAAGGETAVSVTLYQSLLKRDNFEWVLQKGCELGVKRFVPLLSERTVVSAKGVKLERWQRIVTEAAEQCRRGRVPTVDSPMRLTKAIAETAPCRLMAWVGATPTESSQVAWQEIVAGQSDVALFIGPEGGFSDDEVALAREQGMHPISLGPRTLRAETAAITAVTLLMHHLNEL